MQLMYIDLDRRVAQYRAHRLIHPHTWSTFQERLQLSWLVHDYALEGVALDHAEIERALGHTPARHHCDSVLRDNIRHTHRAITQVCQLPERGGLTLEDLKHFHTLLCAPGEPRAGRYRKQGEPPQPYNHEVTRASSISYRLRKLVETIEEELLPMHPVRAAALVHHEFLSIWPFDDRSGAAGRLLMNDWLMRAGYPPAIIHACDRHLYYSALEGDPEQMVSLVRRSLESTLRCAEHHMRRSEHQIA
jgi:hypothetical protein